MKRLFLTSDIHITAEHIAQQLKFSGKKPKTAFITTAAEPVTGEMQWFADNRKGLVDAGFDVFDYTITDKKPNDLENDLKDIDVLHVNGGNTFWLLLQARKSGFDEFARKYVALGKTYIGSSAGSIIASPNIDISRILERNSYEKELKTFESFNLVDFIILPHWGQDDFRAEYRIERLATAFKPENKIILLNDYQYVHVKDDMYKIVDVRDL